MQSLLKGGGCYAVCIRNVLGVRGTGYCGLRLFLGLRVPSRLDLVHSRYIYTDHSKSKADTAKHKFNNSGVSLAILVSTSYLGRAWWVVRGSAGSSS